MDLCQCTDCIHGQPRLFLYSGQGHRHCEIVMAFLMYARFHDMSEMVIIACSRAFDRTTTDWNIINIELELETAGRVRKDKEEKCGYISTVTICRGCDVSVSNLGEDKSRVRCLGL